MGFGLRAHKEFYLPFVFSAKNGPPKFSSVALCIESAFHCQHSNLMSDNFFFCFQFIGSLPFKRTFINVVIGFECLQFLEKGRDMTSQMSETEMMIKGYGLTTAELFYRMPDHRSVLNTFVWQDYDLAPDHPRLFKFIEFWKENIEGPLHSIKFVHRKLISPGEWQNHQGEFFLQ